MKNRDSVPFTAPAESLFREDIFNRKDLTTDFGDNIKIHRKNHYKMTKLH